MGLSNYTIFRIDLRLNVAIIFKELKNVSEYEAIKHTDRANRFTKKHDFEFAYLYRETKDQSTKLEIPIFNPHTGAL